jgi:uncharacterized membrane protein YfcA
MSPLEALAILAAGMAAGTMNAIVGAGSLITFPTLLFFGYSPLLANVSNTVGLVPGVVSGAVGYRRELAGQRRRAAPLLVAALLGGLTGGLVLLVLPASAFERIVPILILLACVLVAIQPRLSRSLAARRTAPQGGRQAGGPVLFVGVYLTGIYGGYFGAAQGVILIALLAILIADDIQRLNGLKIVLAAAINGIAAILFILITPIAWPVVVLIAIGSIVGGQIGAIVGRRLSPFALRAVIIVVGTIVAVKLLAG